MRAMIFAAGLGTRFKPWTDSHPKALARVKGKSLLQHNIEYLQQYGITEVVVNVHHFADQVKEAIAANNGWGSQVLVSDEENEVLETGGGLLKARPFLQGQPFLTINVDILTDLDIDAFVAFHQQQEAFISLAIADRDTSRYLLFNKENRLCGWRNVKEEKVIEKIAVPAENYMQKAYSGIALFQPEVFDNINFSGKFSLIDIYLDQAADKKIMGYNHSGDRWVDVGRPESVLVAEDLFP